ncbi:beta-mannosidase [Asanoa ishikariensis]|uniref:beta-mannosidase n=1 Tax=Asanoa ishikariensis TaxID=137265 RepID=A0A1H3UHK7_9ACTN|nr:glycoside hydrolase family 2 protein [Asanoa ishikariensis]GIF63497.1 beta-mannosidase [Asanoa ishikariensis]SDZ61930.1 beta-mannosidase [Asanoa ishikariensis]
MTIRADLSDGWVLRLAAPDAPAVPPAVRAALPIPATVPGTVHTDLLAAGLIPDPYLDRNELTLDWIGRVAWVYERDLPAVGDGPVDAVLAFAGLDTVATVSVDGVVVARTANMHRRYEVPVRLPAKLSVRFDSAWDYGEAERDRIGALPNQYPAPFNFLRKMACNFGWDWGPTLVTAGIWRPVTLIRSGEGPRIREVRPSVTVEGAHGRASFDVRLAAPADEATEVTVSVEDILATATLAAGQERVTVEVTVADPDLWWPRGLGPQPLYDAVVRVPGDEWSARIGFRSLRLDTTEDPEGTPFTLVVNGLPVPVRGANWIPDDCFPSRVTADRLHTRIDQAVDAGINLLRVWGGGTYESDEFYAACDARGVLVWQDFLFACAAYPEDERLAAEVDAEARDNVARLMPHPSLVLWNGNNENIWGFFDWDWQQAIADRTWGLGYYLDVLPKAVRDTDPTRPYWPGSPYSGSMERHPNDPDHGPMHVWDVWNTADYTVYREYRPRFVAEFGWQAPPTWSTMTGSLHDDPLTPTSPGMLHHQKASDGNGKLERGLAPHFPVPTDLTDWHFATQLNQARALGLGIRHYRSLRPRCSGTVVWQLNDCWPVTSWAAVDGQGRKKPLWYALRAAHAERLLTVEPREAGLALVAVNDTTASWRVPVTVRRLSFDGTVLAEHRTRFAADRVGAVTVPLPSELTTAGDAARELLVAEADSGERALWFFAEDKDLAYRPADLDARADRDGDDIVLTLTARNLVRDLCVFADRVDPAAEADDCLVTLLPGERRELRVRGVPAGREKDLLAAPVLRTANDLIAGV